MRMIQATGEPVPDEEQEIQLTDQELAYMQLVARGISDESIADHFGVSVVTVRRRVRALRSKLGAASRAQAVADMIHRGLIRGHDDHF